MADLRRNWSRGDTFGAVMLPVGGLLLFNRVVLHHVHQWHSSQYFKSRMVDLGLAAGARVHDRSRELPVICGLTRFGCRPPRRTRLPRLRRVPRPRSAARALHGGQGRVPLDHVRDPDRGARPDLPSPFLLLATVLVFESRRVDRRIVVVATAFVLVIVLSKGIQLG